MEFGRPHCETDETEGVALFASLHASYCWSISFFVSTSGAVGGSFANPAV